jgi:pyruvate dehydrogenase E2 component (dihydrolipoamide acetyltransferase)
MSLIEISRAVRDLGKRARGEGGSLTQTEMTSGTFGTSNLGMFGTDTFAAIIVPPNAGIIAVGTVKEKPVVRDGEIVVGSMMNATISADHRVGDGAEAAVFLGEFQKNLENPTRLML